MAKQAGKSIGCLLALPGRLLLFVVRDPTLFVPTKELRCENFCKILHPEKADGFQKAAVGTVEHSHKKDSNNRMKLCNLAVRSRTDGDDGANIVGCFMHSFI